MSDMSESRRTPREDGRWEERNDEPASVPVDIKNQERQLEEAGWQPVERMGKSVWRHPESGQLYPVGPAIQRLRMDESGS